MFQLNECFKPILPDEIMFVSSKDLEKIFEGSIKEREIEIGKIKKAVFITGIGDFLPSGKVHENRKPFYDDWTLNGNIMFYFPILGNTFKMGTVSVRADSETLKKQMSVINSNYSLKSLTKFQKLVVENKVPATIGGKFDISRICMFFLRKAHIGEVVPSIWPDGIVEQNKINNIKFLS